MPFFPQSIPPPAGAQSVTQISLKTPSDIIKDTLGNSTQISTPRLLNEAYAPVIVVNRDTSTSRIPVSITGTNTPVTPFSIPSSSQTIISDANGVGGTAITALTGANLYTVTTGKTFYMTQLSVGGVNAAFEIRDNNIGGTLKITGVSPAIASGSWNNSFPTYVSFGTNVFIDVGTTGTYYISFQGFEA